MSLKNYHKSIMRKDFLNKFYYANLKQIPKFTTVSLSFDLKHLSDKLKIIGTLILILELITKKRHLFTKSNKSGIFLNIRKGRIVGCKCVLRGNALYTFLWKLNLAQLMSFKKTTKSSIEYSSSLSFRVNVLSMFPELKFFTHRDLQIPILNCTLFIKARTIQELYLLVTSFRLSPF